MLSWVRVCVGVGVVFSCVVLDMLCVVWWCFGCVVSFGVFVLLFVLVLVLLLCSLLFCLCCVALCCVVLCFVVLCFVVLCSVVFCCVGLFRAWLRCGAL